jgi:alanine-synthesizing transaminase
MFSKRTHWPLSLNRLSRTLASLDARSIINLTESNPTHCGLAYESQKILGALANNGALSYWPDPRGPGAGRDAVVAYYLERGVSLTPDQVFITSSTSEAYSYVFRLLCDAGDSVLVPQPSYPLFDFLARLDDVCANPYPLVYDQGWQVDQGALQEKIRPGTRAILAVNPNNPTGSYLSSADRRWMRKLCRENELALVADEVFLDYSLEGPENGASQSVAGETEALALTLSGISKISALPQMKLAWIVVNGPTGLRDEAISRLEVVADTYLSVSAPTGLALPELLQTRASIQPQILRRARANLARLDSMLRPAAPVSRLRAEGGWCAVLRLPATRTDEEWAVAFLELDGVLVHPGHFYDFRSEGYQVVSLLVEEEKFEEGVRRLLSRVQTEI